VHVKEKLKYRPLTIPVEFATVEEAMSFVEQWRPDTPLKIVDLDKEE
jgi:hypothetical protein